MAISESREHKRITALFENVSERSIIPHVSITKDENRKDIPDEVNELSAPGTHCDQQPHTNHILTGQTAETNQIPEFLTGCISTPHDPLSHQHQELSTQVSQNNK